MQIIITGQNIDITDSLRSHVEEKLSKINNHFDHVTTTNVVLSVEKNRHSAESNIQAKGTSFHASAQSDDMYTAIDILLSKLDRQVLKHKEKKTNHHRGEASLKTQAFG